jgi:hypothetical protein
MDLDKDHHKLRSFIDLLCLHIIDCPGEFPDEQSRLWYAFSRLEWAALEQMIHLVNHDHVNLKDFEAFVTSLEEAYRDPNHVNTAKRELAKLCQGNRDFIRYYAEFNVYSWTLIGMTWQSPLPCTIVMVVEAEWGQV